VEVNEQSSIMYVDLKQFSQTGNGDISVILKSLPQPVGEQEKLSLIMLTIIKVKFLLI
jgi:hypothetical protein